MKLLSDTQKNAIQNFRMAGLGYKAIADRLSLSRETIRSFCNRNSISANDVHSGEVCRQCGKPIVQAPGTKHRIFCSDECRRAWWNAHPEAVKQKAVYEYICLHCGRPFTAYGNSHRKYCSHGCYIADRFGGRKAAV